MARTPNAGRVSGPRHDAVGDAAATGSAPAAEAREMQPCLDGEARGRAEAAKEALAGANQRARPTPRRTRIPAATRTAPAAEVTERREGEQRLPRRRWRSGPGGAAETEEDADFDSGGDGADYRPGLVRPPRTLAGRRAGKQAERRAATPTRSVSTDSATGTPSAGGLRSGAAEPDIIISLGAAAAVAVAAGAAPRPPATSAGSSRGGGNAAWWQSDYSAAPPGGSEIAPPHCNRCSGASRLHNMP